MPPTPPVTVAVPVATARPSPMTVTVGAVVYPRPALPTLIAETAPPVSTAVAAAPVPPGSTAPAMVSRVIVLTVVRSVTPPAAVTARFVAVSMPPVCVMAPPAASSTIDEVLPAAVRVAWPTTSLIVMLPLAPPATSSTRSVGAAGLTVMREPVFAPVALMTMLPVPPVPAVSERRSAA